MLCFIDMRNAGVGEQIAHQNISERTEHVLQPAQCSYIEFKFIKVNLTKYVDGFGCGFEIQLENNSCFAQYDLPMKQV